MAAVTLRAVRREFGSVTAVDHIDLDIPDRSFTVLLGPSGCGKTTTLNMIAGLEEVTAGTIRFGDRFVHYLPPDKRNVAMVFQSYALYPNRTVRQNIAFPLRMRRVPRRDAAAKVADAAERLGLTQLLHRRPRELSGGQQQRVALARALVREPDVFLLDEPLSNLDAKMRNDTRLQLKQVQQALNATFILVTHDQVEAMSLADVLVVMNDGRVQQVGDPITVYERPVNRFVAGFVGVPSMNFLDGTIDNGRFVSSGWRTPVDTAYPNCPAVLGVRAENLHLEPVPPGKRGRNDAVVEVVERLGNETLVAIRLHSHDRPHIARCDAASTFVAGDDVVVTTRGPVHLFAADDTGARLDPTPSAATPTDTAPPTTTADGDSAMPPPPMTCTELPKGEHRHADTRG